MSPRIISSPLQLTPLPTVHPQGVHVGLLYRLLGVVASVNGRLWLIRVNFIPANVGVFILLIWGAVSGFDQFFEAQRNGDTPRTQPLGTVLMYASDPVQRYVSVKGVLFTGERMEQGKKGSNGELESVVKAWAPLVDPQTRRALLVQLSPQRTLDDRTTTATITGMLRPMDSRLRGELTEGVYKEDGKHIDQRFVLVEGDTPAAPLGAFLLGISCTALLGLFAFAAAKRNVIFMPISGSETPLPAQETPSLFISGKLHLDEKNRQRFVNVPAAVGTLQSGDIAIVSNIDASSRWMGIKTADRAGVWMMAIRPGSMTEVQHGYLFSGLSRRRAVRFRYVSAMDGGSERAVVATTAGDPLFVLQGHATAA